MIDIYASIDLAFEVEVDAMSTVPGLAELRVIKVHRKAWTTKSPHLTPVQVLHQSGGSWHQAALASIVAALTQYWDA
jgi:hypothetical protein